MTLLVDAREIYYSQFYVRLVSHHRSATQHWHATKYCHYPILWYVSCPSFTLFFLSQSDHVESYYDSGSVRGMFEMLGLLPSHVHLSIARQRLRWGATTKKSYSFSKQRQKAWIFVLGLFKTRQSTDLLVLLRSSRVLYSGRTQIAAGSRTVLGIGPGRSHVYSFCMQVIK